MLPIVLALVNLTGFTMHGKVILVQLLQVVLRDVPVTIDGPLEPPCPLPVPLVVDRVEDLVALGVGQLSRDELPGEVKALRGRGRRRRFRLNRLRGFDLSGIGLRAARISGMGGERSMDAILEITCSMLNACAAGDCATSTLF